MYVIFMYSFACDWHKLYLTCLKTVAINNPLWLIFEFISFSLYFPSQSDKYLQTTTKVVKEI